jgi:DNA-binding response OmpR family regulator
MNKILLIEDNEQLQKYITEYLFAYGYTAHLLKDYDAVLETIEELSPKLILLDITLPKFDGFYYLKLIKKRFSIPVIIISARSEEAEQIRGIEGGADDYITKPFSIGVLIAKINAIIKKSDNRNNDNINVGYLKLSSSTMQISYNGFCTELSKNEFKVLQLLMKNARQIVTREQILEELWDDSSFIDDNTLTVNMTRVKKKLNEIGLGDAILTKRGVGYVFDAACS